MHEPTCRGPIGSGVAHRLLDLSMGEIATFIALVDHGGFTAAARGLHLSQPGVSSRVRRLERALGVTLVDRSFRRLTLTPEGEAFLPLAREATTSLEAGFRRARSAETGSNGRAPATVAESSRGPSEVRC